MTLSKSAIELSWTWANRNLLFLLCKIRALEEMVGKVLSSSYNGIKSKCSNAHSPCQHPTPPDLSGGPACRNLNFPENGCYSACNCRSSLVNPGCLLIPMWSLSIKKTLSWLQYLKKRLNFRKFSFLTGYKSWCPEGVVSVPEHLPNMECPSRQRHRINGQSFSLRVSRAPLTYLLLVSSWYLQCHCHLCLCEMWERAVSHLNINS